MPPLKFDPEATSEEIADIDRHAAFDAVVNDKDDDVIQVVCRRADGTEISLANPARAFYFGDRILYTEEARHYGLGEKQQILNTDIRGINFTAERGSASLNHEVIPQSLRAAKDHFGKQPADTQKLISAYYGNGKQHGI